MKILKNYTGPLVMFLVFEAIAVTLWLTMDNLFYLFNFIYRGKWNLIIKNFKFNKKTNTNYTSMQDV